MLLREVLLERYAPLYQLSPRTIVLYGHTLDRFAEYLGREPVLEDLDDIVVSKFLAHRLNNPARPVRRTTVLKDRVQLCAIAGFCAKKRMISEFLTLAPMRAAPRLPQAYLVEDVQAIVRAAGTLKGTEAGRPKAWYWQTFIACMVQTAGRVGEVQAVTWQCVDRDRRCVTFLAETRKGRTRDVERGISADLAAMLEQQRGEPDEQVWPWTLSEQMRWNRLRRICKLAGVQYRAWHAFRKTAASYLAAGGGNAQQLLDHDRSSTSEKHYLDNRIVGRRVSAADVLPGLALTPTASSP
jgi:integrase